MKRPAVLSVAAPPHTHDGSSVAEIYWNQFFALLPAAVAGIVLWGTGGLRTVVLGIGAAVVIEWLLARLRRNETCLSDGSVIVQGLMLGMLFHAEVPWWLIVVAAFVMVSLGKHVFGGLGGYPLNPVLLSYAIMLVSWPARLNAAQQLSNYPFSGPAIEPLVAWRGFGAPALESYSLTDLFLGHQIGGVGSSMILLLALGGLYLMLRGFIPWRVPVAFLASMFVMAWIFHLSSPDRYAPPLFHLFSGIAVFAAFFLATDFTTTPVNGWAQVIYGVGCGAFAVLIRTFGIHPDGTVFAVLLMNLVQPLIDKIHPRTLELEVPTR